MSIGLMFYNEVNPVLAVTMEDGDKSVTIALKGGIRFLGKEAIWNKLSGILEQNPDVVGVVFDCENMFHIDYTVVHGLKEIKDDCERKLNKIQGFMN